MVGISAETIPAIVVTMAVLIGAVFDYRGFRLPNCLTLPLVLSGVLWQLASGSAEGLMHSLFGILAAGLPLLPAYAGGGMGAGDVKLMAGLGAWMGATFALNVLIIAGLAGWVFHDLRRRLGASDCSTTAAPCDSLTVESALLSPRYRQQLLPFGVMIAAGTLIMLALGGSV